MEERKQAWTTEHEVYSIGALVTTDGSGNPTLSDNVGFASVSKTGTGTYKFVLKDKWKRLIAANPAVKITASNIDCKISAHDVDAASPYITVLTHTGLGAAAATATNQATTAANNTLTLCGHVSLTNPIAAELVSVVNALDPIADGALSIAAQPDYPRKLQVRIVDADSSTSAGTVTLVGVGIDGEPVGQTIDFGGVGTTTIVTDEVYATLTSATVSGTTGAAAGDTIGIGVGAQLGLPIPIGSTDALITHLSVDSAYEAAPAANPTTGVDYTAMSVAPTTAANGTHDYDIYYTYKVTPTQTSHNHTQDSHTHTASGAAADVVSGEIQLFALLRRR